MEDMGGIPPEFLSIVAIRADPADYAAQFVSKLPEEKQKIVKALQGNQVEMDKVLQEHCFAIEEVMQTFHKKMQPHYERRAALIAGTAEPKEDEVAAAPVDPRTAEGAPTEDSSKQLREAAVTTRVEPILAGPGLPCFWLEVLRNHDAFEVNMNDNDVKVMKSLVNVDYVHLAAPRLGFALRFVFGPTTAIKKATIAQIGPKTQPKAGGPAIPAEATSARLVEAGPATLEEITAGLVVPEGGHVLAKIVYLEADCDGDPVAVALDGTEIEWGDVNPTVQIKDKKQSKGKGANKKVRVVKVEEPCESFFKFFKTMAPDTPADDFDDEEEGEPFDQDFERSRALCSTIIPRAAEWFTRRAADADKGMAMDEEDGEMPSDDDEEGGAPKQTGAGGKDAPECKQQ